MHSSERIGTFDGFAGFNNEPLLISASTDKALTPVKPGNTRSMSNKVKRKPVEDEEFFLASDVPIEIEPIKAKKGKEEKKAAKELEKRKKVFQDVKKMSNVETQSKEFGNFIDQRASNPITINRKLTVIGYQDPSPTFPERKAGLKREESIFKIKEDYFSGKLTETSGKNSSGKAGNSSANRTDTESDYVMHESSEVQLLVTPTKLITETPVSVPEDFFKKKSESDMNMSQDEIFRNSSGMGQNANRQSAMKPVRFSNNTAMSQNALASVATQDVDFLKDRQVTNAFLETSKEQEERIRQSSPFGGLRTWRLLKVIVKSNDDIRQEAFAMQMISCMH